MFFDGLGKEKRNFASLPETGEAGGDEVRWVSAEVSNCVKKEGDESRDVNQRAVRKWCFDAVRRRIQVDRCCKKKIFLYLKGLQA